ncbi:hypothetical protein FQN57_005572 [Myotisia sp. PD_48]|nr:hypothetical protein FQN57_005572 [Myotisia sp. PD_48]
MGGFSPRPSEVLPPLILGTATFNSQYNPDPYALPTTAIVHRALEAGVRAFDTSPYYGPAESLLGHALSTPFVRDNYPRHSYRLLTKIGRVASASFDYSPSWIRKSIKRSLSRLHTTYLDVVYCHDVEFVTPDEVLSAVQTLRTIRDTENTIRYIGISGYPIPVLCSLAEMILDKTGEPLDIVMSYANFTLQNTLLATQGLPRFCAAGVDMVLNASPLGMGLLRQRGVPIGNMGDFHPAPDLLRDAIHQASNWAAEQGEKIEVVAIRYALENWLLQGSPAGSFSLPLPATPSEPNPNLDLELVSSPRRRRLGASVMGVSNLDELDETLRVWRSLLVPILADASSESPKRPASTVDSCAVSKAPHGPNLLLPTGIRKILGTKWVDFTWPSPPPDFVNLPCPNNYDAKGWNEDPLHIPQENL